MKTHTITLTWADGATTPTFTGIDSLPMLEAVHLRRELGDHVQRSTGWSVDEFLDGMAAMLAPVGEWCRRSCW